MQYSVFDWSGESRRSVVIRDGRKVGSRTCTGGAVCWLVEWLWCVCMCACLRVCVVGVDLGMGVSG